MSDNIQNMDVKRLRNEVQLLRDELAIMQRKYEDILYNLDDDNFSSKLLKEKDNMKTEIKVTAEGIQSVVSKNISAKFEKNVMPTKDNTTNAQKGMLCEYKDELYYYNDISETWKPYPNSDRITSQFLQTAYGFDLMGDVYLSGDAIISGTIDANRIDVDHLKVKRLCSEHPNENFYAKITSSVGDFGIYASKADSDATPKNDKCAWGLYVNDVVTGYVDFYVFGDNFMGHIPYQKKTIAKGTWEFEGDVYGVEARFG